MKLRNDITKQWLMGQKRIHFIGIGGIGMSGLARILKSWGHDISGSDEKASQMTTALKNEGIFVHIGRSESLAAQADCIIYSSAIALDHEEMMAAQERGIRQVHRAQALSCLMNEAKTSVAITGTHGKTTTSSLVTFLTREMGLNPTCLVGGNIANYGVNAISGNPDFMISEVDESDQSHELYHPNYAVITNLEEDHVDHYRDFNDLVRSFKTFLSPLKDPGLVIYSEEDSLLKSLVKSSGRPHLSFGLSEFADFSARDLQYSDLGVKFDLYEMGFFVSEVRLAVPGKHNILNALAAFALLSHMGLDLRDMILLASQFQGAKRRLEIKAQSDELMVIDDYAHHPTEVQVAMEALKASGKKLTVVFQPHRFSRTKHFMQDYIEVLNQADELILMPIFAAGEANRVGVTVRDLERGLKKNGYSSVKVLDKSDVISYLWGRDCSGIVAFLGAGDIGNIANEFANLLKSHIAA